MNRAPTVTTMLRITSGEFRNRRIVPPETGELRPMLEKPRMAIFSMLGQDVAAGRAVIDCFAGTGVLGLEALSRGAAHALFFELNPVHGQALEELIARLGCADRCTVRRADVTRALTLSKAPPMPGGKAAKLIFVDPPHAMSTIERDKPRADADADPPPAKHEQPPVLPVFYDWLADLSRCPAAGGDTIMVFGHAARTQAPLACGRWRRFESREYGKVAVSLYDTGEG